MDSREAIDVININITFLKIRVNIFIDDLGYCHRDHEEEGKQNTKILQITKLRSVASTLNSPLFSG